MSQIFNILSQNGVCFYKRFNNDKYNFKYLKIEDKNVITSITEQSFETV